jgi:hypothetical protein
MSRRIIFLYVGYRPESTNPLNNFKSAGILVVGKDGVGGLWLTPQGFHGYRQMRKGRGRVIYAGREVQDEIPDGHIMHSETDNILPQQIHVLVPSLETRLLQIARKAGWPVSALA